MNYATSDKQVKSSEVLLQTNAKTNSKQRKRSLSVIRNQFLVIMPVEKRGVKALQIWCRRVTSSYENVNIIDMDSSWRDGLAFCAMIHHFRPNLIKYESLKSEDILSNNELAYKVAEEEMGIPSLLDPQDMLDTDIPDKFSIITYVSQFYHLLKDEDNSRSPSLPIKEMNINNSYDSSDSSPQGTPKSVPKSVFLSNNPILRNNKFSPDKNSTVANVCKNLETKLNISHSR